MFETAEPDQRIIDRLCFIYNFIFNCAANKSLPELKEGRRLVSILKQGENNDKNINFHYLFVEPNAVQLEHLTRLADSGKLKVKLSGTFGLNDAVGAFLQIETHHTQGKLLIVP